jgi:hypothetical protein
VLEEAHDRTDVKKGPKYQDLVHLLDQFKDEYKNLRKELGTENIDAISNKTHEQDNLIAERVKELMELREYVGENKTNLRVYLGIPEDDQKEEAEDNDSGGMLSDDDSLGSEEEEIE